MKPLKEGREDRQMIDKIETSGESLCNLLNFLMNQIY